jgi:hypothetical protein
MYSLNPTNPTKPTNPTNPTNHFQNTTGRHMDPSNSKTMKL